MQGGEEPSTRSLPSHPEPVPVLKRRNRSGDASYIRNARHRVDIIRAHWGNRAAANITRVDISRLLDTFGNRPATQRMVQATISAFFSFCEERDGIAHPCRHMKRRGGARERERFLSDDELRRALPVMRELGYPRGDVMLFSLLTGRRLREVTDMTWSEVDLVARVHHLPASRSKNRKAQAARATFPGPAITMCSWNVSLPSFTLC